VVEVVVEVDVVDVEVGGTVDVVVGANVVVVVVVVVVEGSVLVVVVVSGRVVGCSVVVETIVKEVEKSYCIPCLHASGLPQHTPARSRYKPAVT
jgi:hypothetical protein